MIERLTFIRAGLILNAFLICLVYTYEIKGPWWALAAFVGSVIFMKTKDSIYARTENNECVAGCLYKKPNGILIGGGCLDMWHVIHFFFWTLIGLLLPDMYIPALMLTIAFELYEQFVYASCGRIDDIIINMAGYTIGSLLSKAR